VRGEMNVKTHVCDAPWLTPDARSSSCGVQCVKECVAKKDSQLTDVLHRMTVNALLVLIIIRLSCS